MIYCAASCFPVMHTVDFLPYWCRSIVYSCGTRSLAKSQEVAVRVQASPRGPSKSVGISLHVLRPERSHSRAKIPWTSAYTFTWIPSQFSPRSAMSYFSGRAPLLRPHNCFHKNGLLTLFNIDHHGFFPLYLRVRQRRTPR